MGEERGAGGEGAGRRARRNARRPEVSGVREGEVRGSGRALRTTQSPSRGKE